MRGEQFRFHRQALAQPLQLGRLRWRNVGMRTNRARGVDVGFLYVDKLRLAFDAVRHVPA